MMVPLVFAAALTVMPTKAEPRTSPKTWIPADTLRHSGAAGDEIATFDLVIDATGEVQRCTMVLKSNSQKLDDAICASAARRAKFRPAQNADGQPIASVWRDRVVWMMTGPGSNSYNVGPDFVVTTPTLTARKSKTSEVAVMLDQQGAITQCLVLSSTDNAALDNASCELASRDDVALPILNADEHKVAGIRTFIIAYVGGEESGIVMR